MIAWVGEEENTSEIWQGKREGEEADNMRMDLR